MFDNPGLSLFVAIAIALGGWYAIGTQYNVRLGKHALVWLQKGLPLVGEKATLHWVGSSTVEVKILKANDPFRSAEVLIVLQPREIPFLSLWNGKRVPRDQVIFRMQLRAAPKFELDARLPTLAREREDGRGGKWTPVQGGVANNMSADVRGQISPFSINHLILQASLDGLTLTRLKVRRTVPNLQVHFLLPNFEEVSIRRVIESLRQLGDEVLKI